MTKANKKNNEIKDPKRIKRLRRDILDISDAVQDMSLSEKRRKLQQARELGISDSTLILVGLID